MMGKTSSRIIAARARMVWVELLKKIENTGSNMMILIMRLNNGNDNIVHSRRPLAALRFFLPLSVVICLIILHL